MENLTNSTYVTINQGENAVNIFISKAADAAQNEGKMKSDEEDTQEVQTKERRCDDDDDDDEEEEEDQFEKIKAAMNEIAAMQLYPATSPLQTLLFILKNFVKMKDEAGYIDTLQKIGHHVENSLQINDAYDLATNYMKDEKEFETVVVCKQLVTWYRIHAALDPTLHLKRMVQELMSLARDAVKQMFEKKNPEKEMYHEYLVPMMYEMLVDVTNMPGVEAKTGASMEALGSYFVACVLFFLERWSEMYQVCHDAISKMRRVCGEEAKQSLAYADVLLMAAMAKYRTDELLESEGLWEQTIQAFESEGNSNDNRDMGMNINIAKQWLSIVRVKRQESVDAAADKI